MPLQFDEADLKRGNHGYYGAAVLAPGQTAATATEELRRSPPRLTEQGLYPAAMQFTAFAVPASTTRSAATCGRRCGC